MDMAMQHGITISVSAVLVAFDVANVRDSIQTTCEEECFTQVQSEEQ